MSMYGRGGGRARPQGGGWELAVWYLMRLTGLALFVLALSHFLITHVLWDPAIQKAQWILDERWANVSVRTVDWLMLAAVVFHSFMGVRTVVADYTRGGTRSALTMSLYLGALVLFAMGTFALVSVPNVLPRA
jgi:succinate dehydrogenase / fumarate reductase membrane anchor subunit